MVEMVVVVVVVICWESEQVRPWSLSSFGERAVVHCRPDPIAAVGSRSNVNLKVHSY